ncbi:hypothetical protein DRQ33_03980 [bacterium]|nr:MAG: hypothetical protein DRQ33_03980 [bacterium]
MIRKASITILIVLLAFGFANAKVSKIKSALEGWSTDFTIYLNQDTLWGVQDSALPPTPDPGDPYYVDYENYGSGTPTNATAIDSTDSTIFGLYIKLWARKMTNTAPPGEPESCAVNTNTSYSNVYYAGYSSAGEGFPGFTIDGPFKLLASDNFPANYHHYIRIQTSLCNIKEIDGVSPFSFDDNDSLFVYIEDRYGTYSCYPDSGSECKFMTFVWESNPGAGWPTDPSDPYGQMNPAIIDSITFSATAFWDSLVGFEDDPCLYPMGVQDKPVVPQVPVLYQNNPNPFNASTDIEFSVPTASNVKLEVTDVLGKRVRLLCDKQMNQGNHIIRWDGKDEKDNEMPSGVYFYKLTVGDSFVDKKKMTLIK